MNIIRDINLFLHVIATVIWIGGIIFLYFVGPSMRALKIPDGNKLIRIMNLRFRKLSYMAVAVIVITGIGNLSFYGGPGNPFAIVMHHKVLMWKLLLVVLMLIIKLFHDFVAGPKAAAAKEQGDPRWWLAADILGKLNLFIGLTVVYLALML